MGPESAGLQLRRGRQTFPAPSDCSPLRPGRGGARARGGGARRGHRHCMHYSNYGFLKIGKPWRSAFSKGPKTARKPAHNEENTARNAGVSGGSPVALRSPPAALATRFPNGLGVGGLAGGRPRGRTPWVGKWAGIEFFHHQKPRARCQLSRFLTVTRCAILLCVVGLAR